MKKALLLAFVIASFASCNPSGQEQTEQINLIPMPADIDLGRGSFELSARTGLVRSDGGELDNEVAELQALVKKATGGELQSGEGKNTISMELSPEVSTPEGYELEITRKRITIRAADAAGVFYAVQTIRQLLPAEVESGGAVQSVSLPALRISDRPEYHWRGMNFDVSRHFFPLEYMKKHIDRIALYKFNKLHLHLTDDQGWRIEIKKYPALTEVGAWRPFRGADSTRIDRVRSRPESDYDPGLVVTRNGERVYGGYYSQEEIKELVEYAASKHVELIPEIDMPGHMMAAIRAFPRLSSNKQAGWGGLFTYPLDAGSEEVYTFVENVLAEVAELFPSKYVHIGADEVDKRFWEESPSTRAFMRKQGLEDTDALQSYFVRRVQRFLASKGKETIAWDEALEGGIDPAVNIMYWRTWVANVPEKAVANGNKVINAQGDPLYGRSLYKIYHFDVVRKTIPANKAHLILGAHASLWAEGTTSSKLADARWWPSLMALSEAVWSPEGRDWDGFKFRLQEQLPRLDAMGVNYVYNPSNTLTPIMEVNKEEKYFAIAFDSEKYRPEIRYTLDGSTPDASSTLYEGTFRISGSADIRAAILEDGKVMEPVLALPVDYHKAIGKTVVYSRLWNLSYPGGDAGTFTDGYRGGSSYGDGFWQGFTTDIDVTIDMGEVAPLNTFLATFMQVTGPGVYMPRDVVVSLSEDGKTFEEALVVKNDVPESESRMTLKEFAGSLGGKSARYVRVVAHNSRGFIFTDEMIVN